MRASLFRFWITASTLWAAMTYSGNRLHAMQAETAQEREVAIFISSDDEEADDQKEQAAPPKFWLGITLKPVEGDLANYVGSSDGVLVDSVHPDSPASKAGIEKGDIIVAIGEEKLTDPKSLLAQMLNVKADKDDKAPTLQFKVLRKGESKSIALTPVTRPADRMKVTVNSEGLNVLTDDIKGTLGLSFDLNSKSPKEIEQLMERLHGANSDVRILRFGTPARLPEDLITKVRIHEGSSKTPLEVSINRDGDGPAKVTVVQDGETKEYSTDKMDEMPEKIRKMVTDVLEKKGRFSVENRNAAGDKDAKSKEDGKQVKDRIAEIRNRIALVAPNGNLEIGSVMDKEMAEKVSSMAKEIAARAELSAKWAQAAAGIPEEVKELKSQVELLRAEIKDLREQLREALKPSDK